VQDDLVKLVAGKPKLNVYVGDGFGCPNLAKAFAGGYRYKVDKSGAILDKVHEVHPYEDVIDCLYYFYIESNLYDLAGKSQQSIESFFGQEMATTVHLSIGGQQGHFY
jgi:hypothetical protein